MLKKFVQEKEDIWIRLDLTSNFKSHKKKSLQDYKKKNRRDKKN